MKIRHFFVKAARFGVFLCVSIAIMSAYVPASAEDLTVEEIRDMISQIEQENDQRRDEINQLEGDISEQQANLDEVAELLNDQKQLVDYYNNLVYYKNEEITQIENEVSALSDDILSLEKQIGNTEDSIASLEKQNAANLEKFAQMLRTMYTSGDTDMFGILSESTDFYDLMVRSEIVNNMSEKNLEFMNLLRSDIDTLNSTKQQLETDKANLAKRVEDLNTKKQTLVEEQAEYESLVYESESVADTYQQDYYNYQNLINDLEYQQDNLNYLISISESDIEAYEEQIKQLIIQQSQPDKLYQEGEWIWPVPGYSYISCYFGWDADFGRWHKGVDVGDAGINGSNIYASKGGTVIVAENYYIPGYSYGKYVVIDHGGGYTSTYAHCSDVYVYVGQEVSQGEVIAAVGNTGYSTGPHLHFEIRIDGEPVNPFDYVTIA